MKFEHNTEKLLPRTAYYRRLLGAVLFGVVITTISLGLGALGYCYFGRLSFVDGLLNASMILFSEGPVDRMDTTGGKLFATVYAMFSGVAYISIVGVIFAPVFHRFMHRFHLDISEDEQEEDREEDRADKNRKPNSRA
ncbi:MAG TPA: hypothetical protein VGL38_06420 [bacterium]|jgi:hypothetical protein